MWVLVSQLRRNKKGQDEFVRTAVRLLNHVLCSRLKLRLSIVSAETAPGCGIVHQVRVRSLELCQRASEWGWWLASEGGPAVEWRLVPGCRSPSPLAQLGSVRPEPSGPQQRCRRAGGNRQHAIWSNGTSADPASLSFAGILASHSAVKRTRLRRSCRIYKKLSFPGS